MDEPTLPLTVLEAVAKIERRTEQLLMASREILFSNPQKVIGILKACAVEVLDKNAEYYQGMNKPATDRWLGKSARETAADTLALIDSEELKLYLSSQARRRVEKQVWQAVASRLQYWKQAVRTLGSTPQPTANTSKVEVVTGAIDRKLLRDAYFANFPNENLKVLDLCWAAGQHYSEWKRWLRNVIKDGSAPDRAFRAVLMSGKRPQEYRKQPRTAKWR
jgi:hypothetical protein